MQNKRAVIVDDDTQIQYVIQLVLETLGFNSIVKVGNGAEAIAAIGKDGADIVIMDWKMDVMDGLECTRRIRSGIDGIDPKTPIILLTMVRGTRSEAAARAAGADLFMEKPFSLSELHVAVAKLIGGL